MKNIIKIVMDALAGKKSAREIVSSAIGNNEGSVGGGGDGMISERDNGDGTVTLTMSFAYHPSEYDSKIVPKSDERKKNDAIENEDVVDTGDGEESEAPGKKDQHAEDAAPLPGVSGTSQQCAATFQQCQAKNPYACRFHGSKLMEGDLNAELASVGVSNAKVTIKPMPHAGTFAASVTCKKSDAAKVRRAMTAFSKRPGIDTQSFMDMGYNGNAYSSLYDVDTVNAAQPNATTASPAAPLPTQASASAQAPSAPAKATRKPRAKKAPAAQPATPASQATTPPKSSTPAQAPAPSPAPVQQPQAGNPTQVQASTTNAANTTVSVPSSGARLHPPKAPVEPPPLTGLLDDDISFLEKSSMDMAYLIQRVNHNINKNSPGAGSVAAQNFDAIDRNRLDALSKKDGTGQAKKLLDIYDEATKSKANGWKDQIIKSSYDESKYNTSDPKAAVGYASWGFDATKCQKDPHAAARKAFAEYVPPVKTRTDEISRFKTMAASVVDKKDKKIAEDALKEMEEASDTMADIEDNIALLDNAIAAESDPVVKKNLQDTLEAVERVYNSENDRYEKSKKNVRGVEGRQSLMSDGDDCLTIANRLKAQGKYVPPSLLSADATLNSLQSAAESRLASYISQAGGIANANSNYSNNIKALWNSDDVDLLINANCMTLLSMLSAPSSGTVRGRYESIDPLDGDYRDLGIYNFGTGYKDNRECHKYGALFTKGSMGSTGYGSIAIVFDKKKVTGFIGGPHSRTRGTGSDGRRAMLPLSPKLSGYWGGDIVTTDFSKLRNAGNRVLSSMRQYARGRNPEFWFVGDVIRESIKEIRTDNPSYIADIKADKNAVAFIKANGILLTLNGSEVTL